MCGWVGVWMVHDNFIHRLHVYSKSRGCFFKLFVVQSAPSSFKPIGAVQHFISNPTAEYGKAISATVSLKSRT